MTIKRNPALYSRTVSLLAGMLLTLSLAARAEERVVAIGDVHGAYPEFVSILQRTSLIDSSRKWTGGKAILVQTGDVLDRGQQSRDCLDLLMNLERQAKKQGGRVIPLMGNHEILNILKDLRYVTADIYGSFASSQSEKVREQAYREYAKFLSGHRDHSHAGIPAEDEAGLKKWMDEHPPGFFEYCDAMGPEGKYGAWLRDHTTVVKVGDGLFVHAGLNPLLLFRDIDELNDRVRAEVAAFDFLWQSLVKKKVLWRYMTLKEATQHVAEELKWMQANANEGDAETTQQMQHLVGMENWMINSSQGPLWYRGVAQEPEEKLAAELKSMFLRLKAKYMVSGHTVVSTSGITARFDSTVFLIDAGMLKEAYGGRAAALEIKDGRVSAYYVDGEPQILVEPVKKDSVLPAVGE